MALTYTRWMGETGVGSIGTQLMGDTLMCMEQMGMGLGLLGLGCRDGMAVELLGVVFVNAM